MDVLPIDIIPAFCKTPHELVALKCTCKWLCGLPRPGRVFIRIAELHWESRWWRLLVKTSESATTINISHISTSITDVADNIKKCVMKPVVNVVRIWRYSSDAHRAFETGYTYGLEYLGERGYIYTLFAENSGDSAVDVQTVAYNNMSHRDDIFMVHSSGNFRMSYECAMAVLATGAKCKLYKRMSYTHYH